MNALSKIDHAFSGLFKNPLWIIKEYASANIPCSIFNAGLITENPFKSFHKRGNRHDDIDNVAVSPKHFDAVEHFLEPDARRKFYAGEDVLVTVDTTGFDLDTYRQDWAHRLVHQRRAVLLKQTRDWFHMRLGNQPNNLCSQLLNMAKDKKIVDTLTKQVFRIQNDHKPRLIILLPAPIRYIPMVRFISIKIDDIVFYPRRSGDDQ